MLTFLSIPRELQQGRVFYPLEFDLLRGVARGVLVEVGEHRPGGGGPVPGAARHAALVTAPRV